MDMAKKKFYAVARGRNPGIFTAWFGPSGAQAQVRGFRGAVYKGFETIEEARAFIERRRLEPAPDRPGGRPARKAGRPAESPDTVPEGHVLIYTDGGALGNPGPGGWGAVIIDGENRVELSAGYRLTTNNRMELSACIAALEYLRKPSDVILYSDSKYVVDGITRGWARRWQKNGWMRPEPIPPSTRISGSVSWRCATGTGSPSGG